MVIVVTRQWAA